MKIPLLLILTVFLSLAECGKRRKCVVPHRRKWVPKHSAPMKIGYIFQRNEFEVPNFWDVKMRGSDLYPRFRNSVANIHPKQVSCESSNVTSALKELRQQIKCVPRDSIVNLKAPEGFMVSPNTVMVKKCGGMCNGARSCLSHTTKDTEFYVRAVDEKNQLFCSSILVPEDTSCVCGCETKATDCLPTQKYDKNMCVCKCINTQDYNNCWKKRHMNFIWDEKRCSCSCAVTKICTTGSHWIQSECRCAKLKI